MEFLHILIIVFIIIIIFIVLFYEKLYTEQLLIIDNITKKTNEFQKILKEKFTTTQTPKIKDIIKNTEISLDSLQSLFNIEHNIALNGHNIPETIAADNLYFYIPKFDWSLDTEWLFKIEDKYYIPEGLISIKKGTKFEWTPLSLDKNKELVFYKLFRKI